MLKYFVAVDNILLDIAESKSCYIILSTVDSTLSYNSIFAYSRQQIMLQYLLSTVDNKSCYNICYLQQTASHDVTTFCLKASAQITSYFTTILSYLQQIASYVTILCYLQQTASHVTTIFCYLQQIASHDVKTFCLKHQHRQQVMLLQYFVTYSRQQVMYNNICLQQIASHDSTTIFCLQQIHVASHATTIFWLHLIESSDAHMVSTLDSKFFYSTVFSRKNLLSYYFVFCSIADGNIIYTVCLEKKPVGVF